MALDLDQSKKPKGRTVQKRKKLKGGKEAAKKGKRSKVEKDKKKSKFDIIEVSSPPLWIKVSVIRVGVKRGTWNGMERGMEYGMERGMESQTAKKLKDT